MNPVPRLKSLKPIENVNNNIDDRMTARGNGELIAPACAICLSQTTNNLCALSCGHVFHHPCVLAWFRSSKQSPKCPTCKKAVTSNNDIIKLQLNEATGKMDMYINPIDNDSPCAVEGVELSKSGRPVVGEPNKFVRSKMQHDQYKHRNMPVFINSVNTIKAIGTQNLNYEMVVDMVVEASNLVIDEEGLPGNIGFVPKAPWHKTCNVVSSTIRKYLIY